jgi:hypothetical protein
VLTGTHGLKDILQVLTNIHYIYSHPQAA